MRTHATFWKVACALCLWGLACAPQAAAQDAFQVSSGGLVGITSVAQGAEVQLYFVELSEAAGGRDAALKTAGGGTSEIRFSVVDLSTGTGLVAGDIAAFNLYRSADAVFDGGDALQRSVVPVALGAQTIGFAGPPIAAPDIPDAPASIFFIITATISATATSGHALRFEVAGGHIDIRDAPPPGPPQIYAVGSAIAANDANRVVIGGAGQQAVSRAQRIPVGLEWVAGLGIFGYGVYRLLRRGKENATG